MSINLSATHAAPEDPLICSDNLMSDKENVQSQKDHTAITV